MLKRLLLVMFVISCFSKQVYAYDYDPLLMRAQATIFPKIILLDKNLEQKVDDNKVVVSVLYGAGERQAAEKIRTLINEQYKNNLGRRELDVRLIDYAQFHEDYPSTAYFLLKGAREQRDKVTRYASSQKRLVFCYDYRDFENNALVSVLMKEKTYIYLNKSAIHDYDIKFLPLFYKIVKVIE